MSLKSGPISSESCGVQICGHPLCWQATRNFARLNLSVRKERQPKTDAVMAADVGRELFDDLPMMTVINLTDDYGEDKVSLGGTTAKKAKVLGRSFPIDFTPAPANTPLQSAHRFNEYKLTEDKQKVLTFLKQKPRKPPCQKLNIQCQLPNQDRRIIMWFSSKKKDETIQKKDSKEISKPSFYTLPLSKETRYGEPNSLPPQTPRTNHLLKNSYFRPSITDCQATTRVKRVQKADLQEALQYSKLVNKKDHRKVNKVDIRHPVDGKFAEEVSPSQATTETTLLTMSKLRLNQKAEVARVDQACPPRKYRPITCVSTTSEPPGCVSPPAKPFRYHRGAQDIRLEPLPTPPPPSPSTERDSKYDSKVGGSTVMAHASSRGSSLHGDFTLRDFPASSDENKTDHSNNESEKQTWPKQETIEKTQLNEIPTDLLPGLVDSPTSARSARTNQSPARTNQSPARTNQSPVRTNQSPVRTNPTPTRTIPTPTRTIPTPTRTIPTPTRTIPTPTRTIPTPTRTIPTPTRTIPPTANQAPIQTPGILRNSPAPPPPSPEPPTPPPDFTIQENFGMEEF